MTVLDLGCGQGIELDFFGITGADEIIGIDTSYPALREAYANFPQRRFILGSAMAIPIRSGSVNRIVANVALPYMHIPKTLKEVYRVLARGGIFTASLHPLGFTLAELRQGNLIWKLRQLLILANGILFHLTGWAPGESFQTERGMRIALVRAGFSKIEFSLIGRRWQVDAKSVAAL